MKIAIEAQRIFRKKKGGMDVVALETIKHLQKIDKENEYIIYSAPGDDSEYSLKETSNFRIKFIKGFTYADWEQIWLPLQVQKDKPDILHCTSNTAPLFVSVPKIVTVHDIIYLEKNSWPSNSNLYQRFGNYYRSFVVPQIVKSADLILTVSNFEKKNIQQHFKLDNQKLKVVYNAVNQSFQRVTDKEVLNKIRQKYILPSNYIFFLGNTEPRKNMRNVLKSFSFLLKEFYNAPDLVITNVSEEILNALLKELNIESIRNKINLVGYVDFKDLPALYSLAEFFLYPSFREGFGLPILEAMSCGTPVITSSVSSMPEISGLGALLIDPENPATITEAMVKLLVDQKLKARKIEAGYQRCKNFTWSNSAQTLLEGYESLYASKMAEKLSLQIG